MSKPFEKLKACYEYCRTVTDFQPKVGLILGIRTWQLCEKHEDRYARSRTEIFRNFRFRLWRDMTDDFYLDISGMSRRL